MVQFAVILKFLLREKSQKTVVVDFTCRFSHVIPQASISFRFFVPLITSSMTMCLVHFWTPSRWDRACRSWRRFFRDRELCLLVIFVWFTFVKNCFVSWFSSFLTYPALFTADDNEIEEVEGGGFDGVTKFVRPSAWLSESIFPPWLHFPQFVSNNSAMKENRTLVKINDMIVGMLHAHFRENCESFAFKKMNLVELLISHSLWSFNAS